MSLPSIRTITPTLPTITQTLHSTRCGRSVSHCASHHTTRRCVYDHQRRHQHNYASPSPAVSPPAPSPTFTQRMNNSVQNAVKQVVKSAAKQAVGKLKNGMLADDDFYINGLPEPKYSIAQLVANHSPQHNTSTEHITLQTVFVQHRHIDPYIIVGNDINDVTDSITNELIGTDHPVLRKVANYFFNVSGKRVRPAIVFLLSRAVNNGIDTPESLRHTLQNIHQRSPYTNNIQEHDVIELLPTQRRISEITEMIHTASLLHDDVIDGSNTRRGVPTVNSVFGNKLAILGGDFLLARSSLAMGRLRNDAVTESVSTVIEHLVKGEIMQLKPDYSLSTDTAVAARHNIQIYLTKSFYKTASLIAYACRAVSVLSGQNTQVQEIAFEYGRNIGLAFQIVDDILDITGSEANMGKAVNGADLTAGVLTLPLLYAAEQSSELRGILDGKAKLKDPDQVRRALDITVNHSDGVQRAQRLAERYVDSAVAAVLQLKPSQYQSALIRLAETVLHRQK